MWKKSNIIGGERWIITNLNKNSYVVTSIFNRYKNELYYKYQLKLVINNIFKEWYIMSDKQKIIEKINSINDDEIKYELYLQHEIAEGLEDIKNGNIYTTEELKEIITNW